ncbi:MAG: LysR family transcriptional regulator [Zhengella sp.]|uniref:LysR family transcriptional regulator n=1 Tax=Zhengella sp. TaxID=2282762 RepID=UPI001DD3B3E5|nr:LysR family transcriptional regulator [Notoacmeibacter sp.]MCC0025772.1 LysR family transcriptional regulator [Brucellaceae bacterium]
MAELNYHHLRYFHVVAHEGHLTRAAERLNVSQSALSSQIRQLEERLGQPLFERRGRALHLTEAGRIALDHADAIFAAGQELVSVLKQGAQTRVPLRIGAIATLSRNFQLAFLDPVLARDDVAVILRSGSRTELFEALALLQLDLVLTNQPPDTDALTPFITHRIAEQPVGLIGIPALCPPALSLADRLAGVPLILPATSSGPRADFDALASRLGVTPRIAAEVDDMAMVRLLAREGVGLAVIPPIVVKDELASGVLVNADHLPGIRETFFAVTTRRKYPNPLLASLLEPMKQP